MKPNQICYVVMNEYNYQTSDSVGTVALAVSTNKVTAIAFLKEKIAETLQNLYEEEQYDKSFCEEYWYRDNHFEIFSEKYRFSDMYYLTEVELLGGEIDA